MNEDSGVLGTLQTIGSGVAAIILGAIAWFAGKHKRNAQDHGYDADAAGFRAESDIIEKLRAEVARLSERVLSLEADGYRMRNRVWHLEDELRKHGIPVPPFDPTWKDTK